MTTRPTTDGDTKARCVFCDYAGPSPVLEYLHECLIFEPLSPVTKGHVIVVPTLHIPSLGEAKLWEPEVREAIVGAFRAATFYGQTFYGDFNIIASSGEAATQTVKHLHVHVVPRSIGDGLALPWSVPDA